MAIQHERSQSCLQAILPCGHGTAIEPLEPQISLGQKRPLKISWSNPFSFEPGHLSLDQIAWKLIESGLKHFQRHPQQLWETCSNVSSHSSQKFLFMSNLNLPSLTFSLLDTLLVIQPRLQLTSLAASVFLSPVHQDPQVQLHGVVLNPFIPQSALRFQIVLTQVHKLVFGLVELDEVHMSPHLKPVSSQTGLEVAIWNGWQQKQVVY